MKLFIKLIVLYFFLNNIALGNEKINLRYIDMNYIINNSDIGKKIIKKLEDENVKNINSFKNEEKKLAKTKSEILAQKNVISEKEFEQKVIKHQENLNIYQNKRKKSFEDMNNKKNNLTNSLLNKIDKILIEYSKNNSIDVILKKESMIISNSNFDITKNILDIVNKTVKEIN